MSYYQIILIVLISIIFFPTFIKITVFCIDVITDNIILYYMTLTMLSLCIITCGTLFYYPEIIQDYIIPWGQ